jgi:hypothetical protein
MAVVLGGPAFNPIPYCRPGVPLRWLVTVALIVLALAIVVFFLAVGHLVSRCLVTRSRPLTARGTGFRADRRLEAAASWP